MKKIIIYCFLLPAVLLGIPVYALGSSVQGAASSRSSISSEVRHKDPSDILTDKEIKSISDLAGNLGLPPKKLKSVLLFKVGNKNCALVPICNLKSHKDCFIRIFAKSDSDYMKYYLDGKNRTPKYVFSWFLRSLSSIGQKFPKSITFLIKVEDKIVGRIGIGPLRGKKGADAEIGYALEKSHSGQGIMKESVKTALNFLQCLKNDAGKNYKFTRIRATAKSGNVASTSILKSRGFKKSKSKTNDGYGVENEYFYYFK